MEKYPIPIVSSLPNDPLIDANSCKALFDSKFPDAWDIQTGSSNVIVGIIDLGIDWDHPDISINNLAQNITGGTLGRGEDYDNDGKTLELNSSGQIVFDSGDLNGVDDDGNGKIDDLSGWDFKDDDKVISPFVSTDDHGLSMSGIIAATGNNNEGAAGVAYNSKIINCRAGQNGFMTGDWIGAIYYLANIGVKVINMSFFGPGSQAALDAIDYAYDEKGCVIVACGGYTGSCPSNTNKYPASYEKVLGTSVLASDGDYMRLNTFVNDNIDVLASQNFRFPYYNSTTSQFDYGYSMHSSGTSAMTAGLAALLASEYPSWTNDSIVNQIKMTCTNKEDDNRTNSCSFDFYDKIGHGLINAYKALTFSGTISEDMIWNKNLKVFHNITVNANKTLTLRPNTNLEFQSNKTFVVNGTLVIEGNLTINQNIEVNSGGTIEISPGAIINFTSGKSLIIKGTLTAEGTSSDKITFERIGSSGTWGGIVFDGSSTSNSLLNYVEVKNGSGILCINEANITIQNSLIEYCTHGIYVYNSQPEIINNIINEPLQNGIYGEASMQFPILLNNTITKTNINQMYREYQGIWFVNSPEMYAAQNDVSGFFWGAYFGGGTMALLTDYSITQYNPNNRFTDNSLGIAAAWGSYVLTYPNNSIYNNNSYDAYATNSGELYAQNNYWGGSSANKYADGTSTIDAANYLVDDPWDGYSAIASTGELTPKEFNKKETLNSSSPETGEGSPFINNFLTGLNLEKEGKINDAIAHYMQMINNETSARFALLALAKISVRYSKHDLLNYFKELLSNPNKSRYQSTIQNLLASIHLQKGNYSAAMNYYDEIIKDNSSRYEAANARFEKFFAALHIKKDKELAGKLLSEIQSAATDFTNEDFLMRLETAEYLLPGPEYNVSPAQTLSKENTNTTNSELPEEYALFGNYPNPFNPGTTISYTLPYQSEVEIIVYDIMGREIRTFNTVQAAGTQNTYWDGLNANGESISSGIYFYRLEFKSLETGDLFETVSKMMLLK